VCLSVPAPVRPSTVMPLHIDGVGS
jgi:hypothetical protein